MVWNKARCTVGITAACAAFATGLSVGDTVPPEPSAKVRELYESAQRRYERMESYIVRMRRRETVRGEQRPEELILLKFRQQPWSGYMKWIGPEGKGREGVYVKGRYGNKIHTRLAAGDMPFMPAGKRMALDPDGALIRSASPHPITDLGLGAPVEKIGDILSALSRGDRRRGTLAVVGPERRPEFAEPVSGVEHRLPPSVDPVLPRGGRRTYYFDPEHGLPTVFVATDPVGDEMEYYHYDRLEPGVRLNEDDFDPDRLWPPPPPPPPRSGGSTRDFPGPDRP